MRRLWIVFVAAMLLVSCHHKKLQEQTDSMPVVHEVAENVDTTTATAHDDVAPHPAELQMELDSAEITNLCLFTRKQRVVYNPALLVGEWLNGSEHTLFVSDGSGWFWDTSDSITRETAQLFEWAMDSNLLVFKYTLALGGRCTALVRRDLCRRRVAGLPRLVWRVVYVGQGTGRFYRQGCGV